MKGSIMYIDFKCVVCEKFFFDLCYLDCLYVFCVGCIIVEEEQKIKCFICFIEIGFFEGGFDVFLRIKILEDFVEKNFGIKYCEVCKLMKKVNDVIGFCVECKDYFC